MVALKLIEGKEHSSPDNYKVDDLVTYADTRSLSNQKPYIAAVITSSSVDGNVFVLGNGRNTNHPRRRKRRSTTSGYFNGPLEPGASYIIFQRIIINNEVQCLQIAPSPLLLQMQQSSMLLIACGLGRTRDIMQNHPTKVNKRTPYLMVNEMIEPVIVFYILLQYFTSKNHV